ncbi:MAG: isoleucine--tRNA ligase, partial [Gemmatimonadota bacterium]|nr:isoleucine--tRNA ligase [Gemmatimonadota bacterium]
STRIGYWLDYSDPYITYSNDYVESVWWALATLHQKGLLYRGHKILPYCSRCGTALSSHEVAQGYEDVKDPSVFLALPLLNPDGSDASRKILVWTTTPWTLVSNTALAVHPELVYVELVRRKDRERVLLAEARVAAVLGDDFADRWDTGARFTGAELVGLRYRRPLDWVTYPQGEHELIVGEEFVSADDGTGVVHMSPAFGADDYAAGQRHGLAFVQPVNARGEFPADMPLVGGMFVKKADPLIVDELKKRGVLWKATTIEHSYPHCWRCGTPLLYYARESWFVRTTSYRDAMLARNARVNWNPPEIGSGRFGEWLENNIDWAVSRDRYWGTPLPLWVCERDSSHVEAIGSYAALAERVGRALPADFDPHKPFIDRYEWPCGECRVPGAELGAPMMRRTTEVIDGWFDSGSMPFAQWHFPFENQALTASQYPADFIAEGLDQTRGWFYSMLAIASGMGDAVPNNLTDEGTDALAAPYRAVVVNNLILDAAGVKMSKHLGNTVDPFDVTTRYGADAVRLFLVAASQVWLPRKFDEKKIGEISGRFLLTLKNIYSGMFAQYANFGWTPGEGDPPVAERSAIDRWILSRLSEAEREADRALTGYDVYAAVHVIMRFVDEDVSKWYVRQTRARFYDVESDDNRAAFATLHEVLVVACRLLAPVCPFVTDWVHRELTGESVHLAAYVRPGERYRDIEVEQRMDDIRTLATLGHAARDKAEIKVRQPLERMVCVVPNCDEASLHALIPLLAAELNVKTIDFAQSGESFVRFRAKPNFRTLGKVFGKGTPLAAKAVEAFSHEDLVEWQKGSALAVSVEGVTHVVRPEDFDLLRESTGDLVVESQGGYFAALDVTISPALRLEGLARELVSRVQRMRKEAGLLVSDRIVLWMSGDAPVEEAARDHEGYIRAETLATELHVGAIRAGETGAVEQTNHAVNAAELDGLAAHIALTRVG